MMKVLATQIFIDKVKTLTENDKSKIATITNAFSGMNIQALEGFQKNSAAIFSNNVFVYRVGELRLFYSVIKKGKENIIFFVDIAKREDHIDYQSNLLINLKNPKTNISINPMLNPNINPTLNPNINPTLNPNINPTLNPNINPTLNPNINPMLNPNINPMLNPNINPMLNPNISPRMNPYINPHTNPAYSGLVIYDFNIDRQNIIIQASEEVILLFDFNLDWKSFGVKAEEDPKIYIVFNTNNEWTGTLISDGAEGYNYFAKNNDWVYFVK